jgi:hypothetical protein
MASWFDSVTWLVELRMDLLGGAVAWYDAGLTSAPVSTTATWVDVSDRVVSFTARRGRNDELDLYTAGTAVLRLDNRDRAMDPTYALGPYFGQLTPRQRIRIRCTYGGITYGVWHGVVDDWPQSWQVPSLAYVDLPCTDLTYLLSVAEVPSAWEAYVESLEPWAWFRLGTDGGLDNSGNGRDATSIDVTTGFPAGVGDSLVVASSTGSATGALVSSNALTADWPSTLVTYLYAFVFALRLNVGETLTVGVLAPDLMSWSRLDNNTIRFSRRVSGTTTNVDTVADGDVVIVAMSRTGGTTTVYVDGSQITTFTTLPYINSFAIDSGQFDELVVFDRALTPVEVARLAALAHGEASARTDEWADLVLDAIDWPAGDRMLGSLPFADATFLLSAGRDTPFDGTLATVFDTPTSALAALRQLERTEQGRCFIDRDGRVVFRTRTWSLSATRTTVSQSTFGDSGAELGYTDLSTNESGERLRNVWIVGDVTASDSTSITRYGRSTGTVDGIWALPHEADTLAAWLVSRYKDPSTRVVSMTVEVRAATATIAPAVLGLELGDLVTVRRRPQNVGAVLEVVATVEGIAHTVTADGRWRVQIQTGKRMVPASTTYAVVGTATVGGTAVIAP